jgi:flagellar biosynthesis protein FliR
MKINLKKYFDKIIMKKFFINLGITFVGVLGVFTLLTYIFTGELPNNMGVWTAITLTYAILDSVKSIRTNNKIEVTDQLVRDNYWKLKNELKRKVNRRK